MIAEKQYTSYMFLMDSTSFIYKEQCHKLLLVHHSNI